MTTLEKRRFVKEFCYSLKERLLANALNKNFPDEYNGNHIRAIAQYLTTERGHAAIVAQMQKDGVFYELPL